MYWELRYWWACASGWIRRRLGLAFATGRTLSEIMYDVERDPQIRKLLREARKSQGREGVK